MWNFFHFYSDGQPNNIPWLFTKKDNNVLKDIIQKSKFPNGFASNIKSILTKKGEFGGAKTND